MRKFLIMLGVSDQSFWHFFLKDVLQAYFRCQEKYFSLYFEFKFEFEFNFFIF